MFRKWKFQGDTSRQADLYGTLNRADATTLGNLREFVAKLEQWPDHARVAQGSGLVIRVTFWESAPDLTVERTNDAHD